MKFGKKNFKRILVYIFILSCLSPILYFHYPKLFPIHRGGYLRGTEYESLERFHTGNHGDMEIFKVEGIVYNVNFEDSTKVSFDINAWDVKTKESLYIQNVKLPKKVDGINEVLEEMFPEFGAVSLTIYFKNKDIYSYKTEKFTVTKSVYLDTLNKIYNTVFSSSRIYKEFLTAVDTNEKIEFRDLNSRLTTIFPLCLAVVSPSQDNKTQIEESFKMITDVNMDSLLSFGSTSCLATGIMLSSNVLNNDQKTVLVNKYCNNEDLKKRLEMLHRVDSQNQYNWSRLEDFILDKKIDYDAKSFVPVESIYTLLDLYAYSSVTRYPLTESDIIVSENNVAKNIMDRKYDLEKSEIPFDLWVALIYTVSQIDRERYKSIYEDLVIIVQKSDKSLLLRELEKNSSMGILALWGLSSSENQEIRDLVNGVLAKMLYLNIYPRSFDGYVYDGLWSKRKDEKFFSFSVVDNLRYIILLNSVYEE